MIPKWGSKIYWNNDQRLEWKCLFIFNDTNGLNFCISNAWDSFKMYSDIFENLQRKTKQKSFRAKKNYSVKKKLFWWYKFSDSMKLCVYNLTWASSIPLSLEYLDMKIVDDMKLHQWIIFPINSILKKYDVNQIQHCNIFDWIFHSSIRQHS